MNAALGLAAYRQASVSVHPAVAVVRLFDEALLAIAQAMRALDEKRFEVAFGRVLRAAAILRGLDHSLDFKAGGDLAETLHDCYQRYILILHMSFGKPDRITRYSTLMEGLADLRDSFAEIAGMKPRGAESPAVAKVP